MNGPKAWTPAKVLMDCDARKYTDEQQEAWAGRTLFEVKLHSNLPRPQNQS